ncbi:MAG: hypothetical protein JWR34_3916 [Mycobacterium sp.]|nr:hypothetical protein [Mycobacterium sp.]
MSRPTLEPLWDKTTGQLGYKLSFEGVNKALFFKRAELEALQSLIGNVLEDNHSGIRT